MFARASVSLSFLRFPERSVCFLRASEDADVFAVVSVHKLCLQVARQLLLIEDHRPVLPSHFGGEVDGCPLPAQVIQGAEERRVGVLQVHDVCSQDQVVIRGEVVMIFPPGKGSDPGEVSAASRHVGRDVELDLFQSVGEICDGHIPPCTGKKKIPSRKVILYKNKKSGTNCCKAYYNWYKTR